MASLSPARKSVPVLEGLELLNRGKVRDTYRLPNNLLLIVVTDGVSVFDFVLNTLIPVKGYVLAAITHFWLLYLESQGVKTHLVAAGTQIDQYLPGHLRGNVDLQRRGMVVMELEMVPVEFIARFCLTGSVLKEYQEKGTVYGKQLPPGMRDGDELAEMLFTPTTKATEGHDEPIDADGVRAKYPEATDLFFRACQLTFPVARERSILAPDTKGEIGKDKNGEWRVGDEWFTPDSSRFWDLLVHKSMRGKPDRKAPPPLDKQFVRAIGLEHGVNKLDPKNPGHVAQVHGLEIPWQVVADTSYLYQYVFYRLVGMSVDEYGKSVLGIGIPLTQKKIAILFGSHSDIPQMKDVIQKVGTPELRGIEEQPIIHVISCHRNHRELVEFVERGCDGAVVVIAIAGKAAALPGMLDALIHRRGAKIPVIGVGVGEPGSKSWEAARLSIEELPNEPVVINEVRGRAYMGPKGLEEALQRISSGVLPPAKKRPHKPAELYINLNSI